MGTSVSKRLGIDDGVPSRLANKDGTRGKMASLAHTLCFLMPWCCGLVPCQGNAFRVALFALLGAFGNLPFRNPLCKMDGWPNSSLFLKYKFMNVTGINIGNVFTMVVIF